MINNPMRKGSTETAVNFTLSSGQCLMSKPLATHTSNISMTSGLIPVSNKSPSSSQSPLRFPTSLSSVPFNPTNQDLKNLYQSDTEPEWAKESRRFQNSNWPGVGYYEYSVWWNLGIHVWQWRHGRIRCWCRSPISMLVLWKIYFYFHFGISF